MPISAGNTQWHLTWLKKNEWHNGGPRFIGTFADTLVGRSGTASVMEANVMVDWYRVRFEPGIPTTMPAKVDFEFQLSDTYHEVVGEWRAMHPEHYAEMQTYRSRLPFHYTPLQVNEFDRQAEKFDKSISKLQEIISSNKEVREDIRGHFFDTLERHAPSLSIGEHFFRFVADHKHSSYAPGQKWPQILNDPEEQQVLLKAQKDNVGMVLDNRDRFAYDDPETWVVSPYSLNIGGRGRNETFPDVASINEGRLYGLSHVSDRNVFYNAGWALNAMLPEPEKLYKENFEYAADKLGLSDRVICPVTHGCSVYERIADGVENGHYINVDASGWDGVLTQVTNITSTATPLLPHSCLLFSGGWDTSIEGTVAHLELLDAITQTNSFVDNHWEEGSILGDDFGGIFDVPVTPEDIEIPGLYKVDKAGTRLNHFLGMSMLDPERIHPVGTKISVESPEKTIRIAPNEWTKQIEPTHDERTREIVKNIHIGYGPDGETPMREVFHKVDLHGLDYVSPSQIVRRIDEEAMASF